MNPIARSFSSLCAHPEVVNQLLGGTIASVRDQIDHQIFGTLIRVAAPVNWEGEILIVPVSAHLEDKEAGYQTFLDFENGLVSWRKSEFGGLTKLIGVVNGEDRLRLDVMPDGKRLGITFLR